MRITEYVGKGGVVSSTYDHSRAQRPCPGDLIRWGDDQPGLGRVWQVGGPGLSTLCDEDEVYVCESLGSAFLGWIECQPNDPRPYPYTYLNGKRGYAYVDISGGPFVRLKKSELKATFELGTSDLWNWGDNLAGADMGVHYQLVRPIFATEHKRWYNPTKKQMEALVFPERAMSVEDRGVKATITASDGADGAVLVMIDTEFEPDASDGGPGLRVLINDYPTYEGTPYTPKEED